MDINDYFPGTITTGTTTLPLYTCIICRKQQARGHTIHVYFCDNCIKELRELIELKQGLK